MMNLVMYNPVILKKDTPYETEEGCLSLDGVRKTPCFQNTEVEFLDRKSEISGAGIAYSYL